MTSHNVKNTGVAVESTTEKFVDYVSFLKDEKDQSNGKIKRGKVLRNAQVQVSKNTEEVPSHEHFLKPHLTIYRNRGIVESIEIICTCGQQLKIDLVYSDIEEEIEQT